ncbi:MAG TPA: hypothetical protein VEY51_10015 [Chondromyces sp.]|nr:hypothetical protein [Chondromyces sp.]
MSREKVETRLNLLEEKVHELADKLRRTETELIDLKREMERKVTK